MKTDKSASAAKVLASIQDHYARQRAMPSFAEVARAAGISVSTVAFHVESLKSNGYLGATETGRLVPGKAFFQRTVVSSVRAGLPAYADDSAPEPMLIDEYLIDAPSRTFLLTVKGESMVDAGLMPGDTVVVKRGALANPGDIVVVNANGEGTVKELAQDESGELYLRARNAAFPDIAPADGFEVMGVVVGQFRRYGRSRSSSQRPALRALT
jgi:SOS regulatory protein LexA